MPKLKLIVKDGDNKYQNVINVGETWPEQLEVFYDFLVGQGFIITYISFLEQFEQILVDRSVALYEKADKGGL